MEENRQFEDGGRMQMVSFTIVESKPQKYVLWALQGFSVTVAAVCSWTPFWHYVQCSSVTIFVCLHFAVLYAMVNGYLCDTDIHVLDHHHLPVWMLDFRPISHQHVPHHITWKNRFLLIFARFVATQVWRSTNMMFSTDLSMFLRLPVRAIAWILVPGGCRKYMERFVCCWIGW